MERLVLFRPTGKAARSWRWIVGSLLVFATASRLWLGSYLTVDMFILPILVSCVVFRRGGLKILPVAAVAYSAASWLNHDLPNRYIWANSLSQSVEWAVLSLFVLITLDRYAAVKRLESRIHQDLELARRLQSSLIQNQYDLGTVRIHGFVRQSLDVGGDFYYFRPFLQKYVVFCLGDVMGKGISASLLMALVMGFMFEWGKKSPSPGYVLRKLNHRLTRLWHSADHSFITLFYAVYCEETRELTYSAAGHQGALRLRPSGEVSVLSAEGLPLGLFEDSEFIEATVTLETGDRVILITDGVSEARSPDGELFGVERLQWYLSQHRNDSSEALLSGVEQEIEQHTNGKPTDDVAMMVFEVRK